MSWSAEGIRYLAQLDRLGFIELRPLNRYRLLVAKTFRWRPGGPVMRFFRERAVGEFFDADFDGEGSKSCCWCTGRSARR